MAWKIIARFRGISDNIIEQKLWSWKSKKFSAKENIGGQVLKKE